MRINVVYNLSMLLFLHAICSILCFTIEDSLGISLQMLTISYTYWTAFLRMVYITPILLYFVFKKDDTSENITTKIDNMFKGFFPSCLILVLLYQIVELNFRFISGDLAFIPVLLGIFVNIFAAGMYFSWLYFYQQKVILNNKILLRKCILGFIITSLIICGIITNIYSPITMIQQINKDVTLHKTVNYLKHNLRDYNNLSSCDIIKILNNDSSFSRANVKKIQQIIRDGNLKYTKIDDNKYKISWSPYIEKTKLDNILGGNRLSRGYYIQSWFYIEHEYIIELPNNQNK